MKFGPVPIVQAKGKILGHNIAGPDGRRALRKGKLLTAKDLRLLDNFGREVIYVAELEDGDMEENAAADQIAQAVSGGGLQATKPNVGRVNLIAETWSVLRVDAPRVARINECEGITLATLPSHTVVQPKKITATIKIIPFALPERVVCEAKTIASEGPPIIQLFPLMPRKAALILSSSPFAKERVLSDFIPALDERIKALGSEIETVDFVPLEDESGEKSLAEMIQKLATRGVDIIILAGETAIMDRYDIAPRAVERAGGEVISYGAPIDPGNLLMIAYLGDIPIIGAPGCVRSRKRNVIDWVLPPLLAGDRLTRGDIIQMGHGGLLEDIPKRPVPRE